MEAQKRIAAEAEEIVMQQNYPTPTVDGPETQYYHIPRDQDMEYKAADQREQQHHHDLDAPQDHDDHHDLRELQEELQEASSPSQHHSRQSVSADELQLAAQLTQGLAPMVAAAAAAHSQAQEHQEQQQQQQYQPEDVEMQSQEPDLQEQLQVQLQNHDHGLNQGDMHHAEQQPPHHVHYMAPPQAPQHIAPHMQPMVHPQYQTSVDNTPPRKRSKVSRACDECRRKKIKCDAQIEGNDLPCSNCRRSSAPCLFSRVPQKRGPSKGYIKELADRINSIEGVLVGVKANPETIENGNRRASAEAFPSPMPGPVVNDSGKRPYSSISTDTNPATPTPNRVAGWVTEHRPLQPYQSPAHQPSFSASDLIHPRPIAPAGYEAADESPMQSQPAAVMDGMLQDEPRQDGIPEIEDMTFELYLKVIHPTFPILASTKPRVQALLSQCPHTLQQAFHNAFVAVVKPFLPAFHRHMPGDSLTANRLLGEWEAQCEPRPKGANLIYLQCLIMMAIEADFVDITFVKDPGGPPKSATLGRAIGLGFSLKLHIYNEDLPPSPDSDQDDNLHVALRAWWSLVMLERWNAIGTATPSLITRESVPFVPNLRHVLGDVVMAMIELSSIIAPIQNVLASSRASSPSTNIMPLEVGAAVGSMASHLIDSFRVHFTLWESFQDCMQQPALQLAYWHIRLIADLFLQSRADNVLLDCKKITGLLFDNHEFLSPLNHHFISLVSVVLLELYKEDGATTREEAARLMRDILEFRLAPSPWVTLVRDKIIMYTAAEGEEEEEETKNDSGGHGDSGHHQNQNDSISQNLHQLAALAAATKNDVDGEGEGGEAPVAEDGAAAVQQQEEQQQQSDFDATNGLTSNNSESFSAKSKSEQQQQQLGLSLFERIFPILQNGYLNAPAVDNVSSEARVESL
ncbi:glucose transport transcription regulator RGT1 [Diplogelasinospora grovesii]|uniref:Glucose transport transcription regulator RGT1 n=1 Tax=Diplogelasinospora grovesii TaxID=303347 RepID=A0AAN6NH32_9PEZI|nr:glucose transport transcription regulator RGT1 [Diplogelasinospora grovesii]